MKSKQELKNAIKLRVPNMFRYIYQMCLKLPNCVGRGMDAMVLGYIIKKLNYKLLGLSGRGDLNSGPHDPQSCALTGLRYAP